MKQLVLLIIFLNIFITYTFAQNQSAETLLQEGHKYIHANKIDQAIDLYKQSLEIDPNFYAAKRSLEDAYIKKKILDYTKSLPLKCQEPSDHETIKLCLMEHFTIKGQPINPAIFMNFLESIADPAHIQDQVVSINLLNSQDSNRFFIYPNHEYDLKKYNDFYQLSYSIPQGDESGFVDAYSFKVEGRTDNNIYVVKADYNIGRLTSSYVLFFKIYEDLGIENENVDDNRYPKKLLLTRKRLLIKKIGQITLYGDSPSNIKIQNNTVIISNEERIIHVVTESN